MAFSIPNGAFKLQGTEPDYGAAIDTGIQRGLKPKQYAEQLVSAMLANKVKGVEAKYAPQRQEAELNHLLAQTQGLGDEHGLRGLRQQLLQQQINSGNFEANLNNSLFGEMSNTKNTNNANDYVTHSFENGESSTNSKQVVNEGNPSLYKIDELYEKSPQYRKALEKRGFKQTQVTKYDPKTGVTSVITTSPSGKVTLSSAGVKSSNGTNPLTTPTRTKLQIQKQAIPQLKNLIKELKESVAPFEPQLPWGLGTLYYPGQRAKYHGLVNTAKDLFVKAKGLNVTDKSLETGEKVLSRGTNETNADYHKRLDALDAALDEDENDINQSLSQGISTKKSNDNKNQNWGDGFGEIQDPNTKQWVTIPVKSGEWNEFLKDGGRRHG